MKNKLLLLLKINIINTYKLKTMNKKKWLLILLLTIYLISSIVFTLSLFMNNLFKTLNEVGMSNYYIIIIYAMASLCAFAFCIFNAKNSLFGNKDNDLLFSLPLKKSEILTSRLLMIAVYNLALGLLFIIPGLIIYFRAIPFSFSYIIIVFLLTLFFSIVPTILASVFGYLVALITSKARSQSMVELFCYSLFIALYLIIMGTSSKLLTFLISNSDILNILLKTLFLPLYLIYKALDTGNIVYVLEFIIFNLICLYLFIKIFNKSYLKIITNLNAHKTKSHNKIKNSNLRSIKKALLYKETKKYFGSAIYVFNTLFGIIIILVASIASLFYSSSKLIEVAGLETMNSFMLVFMLLLFAISLTNTTNSSISIERENFWIMKMIPVSVKDIFKAKINLNRILIIPACIFSLILFYIAGYITVIETILLMILTIIYAFFITNYGLIVNLLFPKLDAINDTVIVKQSVASMVGIMGGIAFFGIMFAITSISGIENLLAILISITISGILLIISHIILNKWGIKRFLEIN